MMLYTEISRNASVQGLIEVKMIVVQNDWLLMASPLPTSNSSILQAPNEIVLWIFKEYRTGFATLSIRSDDCDNAVDTGLTSRFVKDQSVKPWKAIDDSSEMSIVHVFGDGVMFGLDLIPILKTYKLLEVKYVPPEVSVSCNWRERGFPAPKPKDGGPEGD